MNVPQLVPALPAFDPLGLAISAWEGLSWLFAPLSGNDRWLGIALIDVFSAGLGIFARWL